MFSNMNDPNLRTQQMHNKNVLLQFKTINPEGSEA